MKVPERVYFAELFRKAHEAGMAAGAATTPAPMVVNKHASPLDDSSPVVKSWVVPDGVCGFAWVTIRPATSAAARYAKEFIKRGVHKGYHGGIEIMVHEFGQSLTRKEAYARAYARVLEAAGIRATADSRID